MCNQTQILVPTSVYLYKHVSSNNEEIVVFANAGIKLYRLVGIGSCLCV